MESALIKYKLGFKIEKDRYIHIYIYNFDKCECYVKYGIYSMKAKEYIKLCNDGINQMLKERGLLP